ncbi:DUF3857 domain-containing protein [Geojedonia litorea]|uniref:DUF3857 domain-containing protein n=1 Tax=Geojedonia litorea TaxID=1268269 RepID=A0ABV9N1E5_9FLAO
MKHLLTFACLISLNVFSQSPFNSESTAVTRADLTTNVFEKDSTANAVVLYELGKSYVDKKSFKLKTEINKKVKILNRNGFNQSTIIEYLYDNGQRRETISNIIATTYNIEHNNVTTTSINKNEIFEEKYNNNYTIVKFTLPNIKEGSVITYSYTLESPFMYKYKEWRFQDEIPVLHSEYHTSIPALWDYNIKLVGFQKLAVNDAKIQRNCLEGGNGAYADCTNSIYVMKNIPAFREEDYMTTKDNYLSRIEYELKVFKNFNGNVENLTKSWKTTDSEFKTDPELGRQLGKSGMLKELIDHSLKNEPNALKKAETIFNYVQTNYTWNGKYEIFKDVSVKNLIKNKSGKVSEINILLHNLLEEYDIKVKPVLLSTRQNGLPTQLFPVISEFNYLIVQATINSKTYLLDATDKYVSFGELPFRCLNQYGRLLDFDDGSSWIDIAPDKVSVVHHKAELSLDDNSLISGTIDSKSTGYHAMPLKESFFGNPKAHLDHYENKFTNINFLDYNVSTTDHSSFDFDESFKIEYQTEQVSNNLYINPFIFKFFTENPFKLQERSYPIDFGFKDTFAYNMKIIHSDAFEAVEIPKEEMFSLPNNKGTVTLSSKAQGNEIMVYFKISFNDALFDPTYYNALKIYLGKIVDIQKNALIVLKKK